jgi:molybdopterin-guanine dinucleotide biosynthesis protein A
MSTAVILAGGESRRMQRDKLALRFGKQTLLESAVDRFSRCFDTVFISVADPEKYAGVAASRITDIFTGCGPIGGLHAALKKTSEDGVFLVAADMPFADPEAARRIIELAGDCDIGLTVDRRSRYEPLFAFYRKSILEQVEAAIVSGNYKIAALAPKVRTRIVTAGELGRLWNDKLLLNINYPEDYERLLIENTP